MTGKRKINKVDRNNFERERGQNGENVGEK